jgi:hypothetical protein
LRRKSIRQSYVSPFTFLPFTVLESDTRTPLADFFSILLDLSHQGAHSR